ncbi:MAG TPA: hypothetical protein VLG67_05105, partial [Candidatus Saccharimonadales bacterium]|nr:hypothetical protein [Candidatus Saccharimonadales bacterium]
DYKLDGINYSTFDQLSLFLDKAEVNGVKLGNDEDVIGLRINESDFSILDNHIIYRYASEMLKGLIGKNEWIYSALNELVSPRGTFIKDIGASKQRDIMECRSHLRREARKQHVSPDIIDQFTNEQLQTWIESAIVVNYFIHENYDYVLTTKPELKLIENYLRQTRVAKILEETGKPNPDAHYGSGMQQLLYAQQNAKSHQPEAFVLEPESKTILASNNKNFIDYHIKRQNPGIIWGSTGSFGSFDERREQEENYNFQFSNIEPHLKQRRKLHPAKILDNEPAQLEALTKDLKASKSSLRPKLIFCKDIETANRFYEELTKRLPSEVKKMQCYTAKDNKDGTTPCLTEVIAKAAEPGMITVTTIAMGRNIDVPYEREIGMDVFQTFPATERDTEQIAGRTGRQGSPGDVKYYYNREDLQGKKTVEAFREELENSHKITRQYNQKLYDLLAYFKTRLKKDFPDKGLEDKAFQDVWVTFSAWLERKYRHAEDIVTDSAQFSSFLKKALEKYKLLFKEKFPDIHCSFEALSAEKIKEELEKKYPRRDDKQYKYDVYTQPVRMVDCIPPAVIACQFATMNNTQLVDINTVRQRLQALFSDLDAGKKVNVETYTHYLLLNPSSIHEIVEEHKKHITNFLDKAQKRSFLARCLGRESHLHKITQDNHYLLFFKAVTDHAHQPIISLDALRTSMISLLTEYQSYWFVSRDKIDASNDLIDQLKKAQDVNGLVRVLNETNEKIMRNDGKTNQVSFWKVNKRGSRFQKVMDGALNLATFAKLEQKDPLSDYNTRIDQLCKQLERVLDNKGVLEEFKKTKSLDAFKCAVQQFIYKDKYHAKVLEKSILVCLENKLRDALPPLRCKSAS